MLNTILNAAGLDSGTYAKLLGVSPTLLSEWATAQRPIPESYVPLLCDTLGVSPDTLFLTPKQVKALDQDRITPAIWFKFRGENLVGADRESVILIRQLGYFQNELEDVTGKKSVAWKNLFDTIRREIDSQAPPVEQGQTAAQILRETTGLNHGATGIGPLFRGYLRRQGLLIVETPIRESQVEGCSFYVGARPNERPCVFANTYRTTWFRRNRVLMHEVGHAIFDAASAGASLDFRDAKDELEISELRADSFAQEVLVPRVVLNHVAQSIGIKWASISARQLAALVAATHVEKSLVLKAAASAGFISQEKSEELAKLEIGSLLKEISEHALSTREFWDSLDDAKRTKLLIGNRTATKSSRPIRLPVPYVLSVVQAVRDNNISTGKAAELLMIDERELASRFGELVEVDEN